MKSGHSKVRQVPGGEIQSHRAEIGLALVVNNVRARRQIQILVAQLGFQRQRMHPMCTASVLLGTENL